MSVEKPNFSGLVKERIPFTTIPNYVLQNVLYAEALGIWCHLISLPEDWDVNRVYLMSKFGIGRDKLDKILGYLLDNFLIGYLWYRKPDGTVDKVSIVVKNGDEFLKNIINKQTDDSTTLKTRRLDTSTTLKIHSVDKPLSGKTAPTKETYITKENKKQRVARKKRVALPDDFLFSDKAKAEAKAVCDQKGISLDGLIQKFRLKAKDGQWLATDWDLRLVAFAIDERPNTYQTNDNRYPKQEPKSTVKFWEPGNPDYDRLHGLA